MTSKKIQAHLLFAVLLCLSFFIGTGQVSASQANFSVNTIIPENQIDKSKTYFNLKMGPDQRQFITTTLKNGTEKAVTVEVSINSAKTNVNGLIEYGNNTIKKDASLAYPLDTLMTGPTSVVIPAHESKDAIFQITMPSQLFDGIILGGLTFQPPSRSGSSSPRFCGRKSPQAGRQWR